MIVSSRRSRLVTLLTWGCLCFGQAPTHDKPQGYVSDFAGVLDPTSRAAIDSYAARVEAATGAQLAFVTVRSLEGEPIENVANDIFRERVTLRNPEGETRIVALADLNRERGLAPIEDAALGRRLHRARGGSGVFRQDRRQHGDHSLGSPGDDGSRR